ncbi:hypothetical protein [Yokenella regensburgei]|uniref:hypothetical protein n=1 Tax=Yokenella regensburgei TaxID=158877 RepID=UPI0013756423|nr:hypothetical protein [Yokenella regensburgei]KAF1367120.1 hypothetical protein FHR25_004335 [Yokenella regensburgei]
MTIFSATAYAHACAAWRWRNNDGSDENGATPHPPAVFVLRMISVFLVVQTTPPDSASAGDLMPVRKLKCVKQISKISVFGRLPVGEAKRQSQTGRGVVTLYVKNNVKAVPR